MRNISLIAVAAMLIGGAVTANAATWSQQGRHHWRSHHRVAAGLATRDGRTAFPESAEAHYFGDDSPRRQWDSGYHDPNFSSQQDDAYNSRFP